MASPRLPPVLSAACRCRAFSLAQARARGVKAGRSGGRKRRWASAAAMLLRAVAPCGVRGGRGRRGNRGRRAGTRTSWRAGSQALRALAPGCPQGAIRPRRGGPAPQGVECQGPWGTAQRRRSPRGAPLGRRAKLVGAPGSSRHTRRAGARRGGRVRWGRVAGSVRPSGPAPPRGASRDGRRPALTGGRRRAPVPTRTARTSKRVPAAL